MAMQLAVMEKAPACLRWCVCWEGLDVGMSSWGPVAFSRAVGARAGTTPVWEHRRGTPEDFKKALLGLLRGREDFIHTVSKYICEDSDLRHCCCRDPIWTKKVLRSGKIRLHIIVS